jgi:hypothetical protein
MFLIASAGYVEIQLRAEIGDIPPAFLPIGNRRLFEYQLELLDGSRQVVLSLPEGFRAPPQDMALLAAAGVRVLHPPANLSLAQSIAWCIRSMGHQGPIEILHGDTLFDELPPPGEPPDAVSVVSTADHYDWAAVETLESGRLRIRQQFGGGSASSRVLSGWFRFSSSERLVDALVQSSSFIGAIERYSMECRVECVTPANWRDVGHASTYLRVRAEHTRERAFNQLTSDAVSISKTGPRNKILSEAAWYQGMPGPLRVYAPTFLAARDDGTTASYDLEYLYLLSLSDLYVFGALPAPVWSVIFRACEEALGRFRAHKPQDPSAIEPEKLLLSKTLTRLEHFAAQSGVNLDVEFRINGHATPSLRRIAEWAAGAIRPLPASQTCWIHGDPCFSNVFFDFRSERVKMIDPRGMDTLGKPCPWGDPRYDLAKLAHSVYGFYDLIVSDRFRLTEDSSQSLSLKLEYTPEMLGANAEFLRTQFGQWRGDDVSIKGIVVLLFLSMIPLHADKPDRQRAFLANALALYHWMEKGVDLR